MAICRYGHIFSSIDATDLVAVGCTVGSQASRLGASTTTFAAMASSELRVSRLVSPPKLSTAILLGSVSGPILALL